MLRGAESEPDLLPGGAFRAGGFDQLALGAVEVFPGLGNQRQLREVVGE